MNCLDYSFEIQSEVTYQKINKKNLIGNLKNLVYGACNFCLSPSMHS